MKKIQINPILLLWALAFWTLVPTCTTTASETGNSTQRTAKAKFERGFNNAATGWVEIPATVQKFDRERGLFEALTTGVARGVGLAVARTGVGVYEAVTFPMEVPERFESLMMPEKVEG